MSGDFADGYLFELHPTGSSGQLRRLEDQVVVTLATNEIRFEWFRIHCPLHVVDAFNQVLVGSQFTILATGELHQSGETVDLFVTDNTTYPAIAGALANGYDILVSPITLSSSASFQFEILPDSRLLPNLVTIGGSSFGLRCIINTPPSVDAGPNISILSQNQPSTVVIGTASDFDGDVLLFRWLDSQGEIAPQSIVGADQAAPLDLGTLTSLSVGDHTFALEVTDGTVTITDIMVVTIDNSPPIVATGGAITISVGEDLILEGTVADFDGDLLTYSWSDGSTILVTAHVQATAGGDPVSLQALVISGGLTLGSHVLNLSVGDGFHPSVTSAVPVQVIDSSAPRLAPVATPTVLWPPNHQMVPISIDLHASDDSGGPLSFNVDVMSSENADKSGDGHTIPDSTEPTIDASRGIVTLELRAERAGRGPGRTYTIRITATDSSGNETATSVSVVCPHDQRR
ncbi:MAG: hypothetical protein HYR85_12930 [Planctomycetes bacterium]|nr:hypothetical protein [Planctomycetota bacterium]MBI3848312.1 hypothetical protein [Planctomycetota bacterium]